MVLADLERFGGVLGVVLQDLGRSWDDLRVLGAIRPGNSYLKVPVSFWAVLGGLDDGSCAFFFLFAVGHRLKAEVIDVAWWDVRGF